MLVREAWDSAFRRLRVCEVNNVSWIVGNVLAETFERATRSLWPLFLVIRVPVRISYCV